MINIKKAQTAIEFVGLIAFVLFFFTTFFLTIQENISDKLKEKQTRIVQEIALTVQDEINLASQSIDGYYREFYLPDNLNGQEYYIDLQEGMVYVRTKDRKYAIALPVLEVNGDIKKEENIIKKENGEVKLNI